MRDGCPARKIEAGAQAKSTYVNEGEITSDGGFRATAKAVSSATRSLVGHARFA